MAIIQGIIIVMSNDQNFQFQLNIQIIFLNLIN